MNMRWLVVVSSLIFAETGCSDPNADDSAESSPESSANPDVRTATDAGLCTESDTCSSPPPPGCSADGWCVTALPPDSDLNAVSGSGSRDVWAVGTTGTILHWNGAAWQVSNTLRTPTDAGGPLTTILAVSASDVWVASWWGTFHSSGWDGGEEPWVAGGGVGRVTGLWKMNPTNIWAVSNADIFLSTAPTGSMNVITGATLNHSGGWSSTGPEWIGYYSEDADWGLGQSFNAVGGAGDDVWIVGALGIVRRAHMASEGSVRMEAFPTPTLSDLNAVYASSKDDVWVVGNAGTLLHRELTDGYLGWVAYDAGMGVDLTGIWGSGPQDVWVAGKEGLMLHWDGALWKTSSTAIEGAALGDLYGIWGFSADDIWAVGTRAALHRTSNSNLGGTP